MGKYVVLYYNRFACENQHFYVLATNEEDAERLFWLRYNRETYKDCIESIYAHYEPHFYTEEEIAKINII